MSDKFLLYFTFYNFVVLMLPFQAKSQVMTAPGQAIICYDDGQTHRSYVSSEFNAIKNTSNARVLSLDNPFEVEYFNVPSAGQNVVRYATEIWSQIITTSIPIKISVSWTELGTGTLGSARPGSRKANFDGAPMNNVWYPISLAERLARKELNGPDEFEIIISLNQERAWYFGLDGQVTEDVHDLLSVVLHEIGHGLGLSDTFDSDGGIGSWGYIGRPNIYDIFIINYKEEQLIDKTKFSNNSTDLHRQITARTLQYKSQGAYLINSEEYPKIYSPFEFNGGSSISHLDETTYPAGDTNSLMTPQIGREEAIHNTGPLINGILADMGYVWAYIDHDSIPDQPSWDLDVTISGKIASDSTLIADSSFLYYSFDEFVTQYRTPLILSDGQTEFSSIIPAPGYRTYVEYYISLRANNNIVYQSPTNISEPKHKFSFGLIAGSDEIEIQSNLLSVYPNPANGLINVNYEPKNQSQRVVLKVLNLQGNAVYHYESTVDGNTVKQLIDLQTQPPGLYVLQIQDEFNIVTKTILITE